jgi:DNA-binding MarR family transcriptional regulator
MGELGRRWQCDPTNATFTIDRLEKAGLLLRERSASDGRVKLVRVTKRRGDEGGADARI